MKIFDPKLTGSIQILNTIEGSVTIAGGLNVEGSLGGAVTASATASYVEFTNVANKPTLLSGSSQIASDISGSFTLLSSSLASELLKNTTDTLDGDLTVTGKITAQEFHTEFVSASIIYKSGSTQFGNSSDDVHSFTGSLQITGSVSINGSLVGMTAVSSSYSLTSTSASLATVAERVRAGSIAERPSDYVNIATGSLWYNTTTSELEVFTGLDNFWWQPVYRSFIATGGTIAYSGSYTFHYFTSSGVFEVESGRSNIDVLVVGGGGSGGYGHGGGGGGGAVLYKTSRSTTVGQYVITIGAGGASATSNADDNPGNSTTAFEVTATGGGSGANEIGNDSSGRASAGGSGANGGGASYGGAAGGTGTAPNATGWTVYGGYNGAKGQASTSAPYTTGGGAGAGGAGVDGSNDGANGIQINIDGNGYYWAGGGGGVTYDGGTLFPGGDGGLGGGGGGSVDGGTVTAGIGGGSALNPGGNGAVGTDLVGGSGGANTGGGGGGGSNENGSGGSGGSGIVIVRYLTGL